MSIATADMRRTADTIAIGAAMVTLAPKSLGAAKAGMFMPAGTLTSAPREMGLSQTIVDVVRRIRDAVGSMLLLALMVPLMLVVACLIKLDSRGPVLYRQDRVGLFGKVFTLFKFRSMKIDAEADGPRWAAQQDPRVTRIGRIIRASRIDELPQLVNVLRGEMSLVGPRPERPYFTEKLTPFIPGYHKRTSILPGITGLAQVSYRYGASVEDAQAKHTFDVYYLRRRTLVLDLRILMATVWVVLLGIGAR